MTDADRNPRSYAGQCPAARRDGKHQWEHTDKRRACCGACGAVGTFDRAGRLIEYASAAANTGW